MSVFVCTIISVTLKTLAVYTVEVFSHGARHPKEITQNKRGERGREKRGREERWREKREREETWREKRGKKDGGRREGGRKDGGRREVRRKDDQYLLLKLSLLYST